MTSARTQTQAHRCMHSYAIASIMDCDREQAINTLNIKLLHSVVHQRCFSRSSAA